MFIWKTVAMTFVLLGCVFAISPLVNRLRGLLLRAKGDNFKVTAYVAGFFLGLILGLVFLPLTLLAPLVWIEQSRAWWKMLLGSLGACAGAECLYGGLTYSLSGKFWISSAQIGLKKQLLGHLAILIMPLAATVCEAIVYRGTGLTYAMAVGFGLSGLLPIIFIWTPQKMMKLVGSENGPLYASVVCLCVASAIQIFVLAQ